MELRASPTISLNFFNVWRMNSVVYLLFHMYFPINCLLILYSHLNIISSLIIIIIFKNLLQPTTAPSSTPNSSPFNYNPNLETNILLFNSTQISKPIFYHPKTPKSQNPQFYHPTTPKSNTLNFSCIYPSLDLHNLPILLIVRPMGGCVFWWV